MMNMVKMIGYELNISIAYHGEHLAISTCAFLQRHRAISVAINSLPS